MKSEDIHKKINDFLNEYSSNCYWYPLCYIKKNVEVIAFNIHDIYNDNNIKQIEKTLQDCNICLVNSIQHQSGDEKLVEEDIIKLLYEKDSEGYTFPWYVETFYFDSTKSWLIYVSHEGTISFTGSKMAQSAKENISNKYIW